MKRFLGAIFIICAFSIQAQNKTLDNLKSRLHASSNDSVTMSVLDSLSMFYLFFYNNADSTFTYCKQYLDRAIQQQDKKSIVLAYARISFYYENINEYNEALSTALQGLN